MKDEAKEGCLASKKLSSIPTCYPSIQNSAPIAQLDRVTDYEGS
jgi:hypothetical protein